MNGNPNTYGDFNNAWSRSYNHLKSECYTMFVHSSVWGFKKKISANAQQISFWKRLTKDWESNISSFNGWLTIRTMGSKSEYPASTTLQILRPLEPPIPSRVYRSDCSAKSESSIRWQNTIYFRINHRCSSL